jgi:hypothetical protein
MALANLSGGRRSGVMERGQEAEAYLMEERQGWRLGTVCRRRTLPLTDFPILCRWVIEL